MKNTKKRVGKRKGNNDAIGYRKKLKRQSTGKLKDDAEISTPPTLPAERKSKRLRKKNKKSTGI